MLMYILKRIAGFAYLPDDGRPDRVIRFGNLEQPQVSRLDYPKNVLVVDKGFFDALSPTDQNRVLGTNQDDLFVTTRAGRVILE